MRGFASRLHATRQHERPGTRQRRAHRTRDPRGGTLDRPRAAAARAVRRAPPPQCARASFACCVSREPSRTSPVTIGSARTRSPKRCTTGSRWPDDPEPRWITPDSADWPARLDASRATARRVVAARDRRAGVAVVSRSSARGARRSPAWRSPTSIARELGAAGIQVVSGMALGIDAAAHDRRARGRRVDDRGARLRHRRLLSAPACRRFDARIAGGLGDHRGAGGTPPFKYNFPKRNRIIAALAHAVVVVEATERSGALSTARWAADLGREVLAVPGSIRARQSSGTNLLIRDGARPFLGIGDLFDAVPELRASRCRRRRSTRRRTAPGRARAFQPTSAGDTGTHGNATGPPGPGRGCPRALTVASSPARLGCAGACRSRNVPARRPRGPYRITGARAS